MVPASASAPGPASRLAAVLHPVIPELAGLMTRTPGCLSLAQGMVGWGPPATVAMALQEALAAAASDPAAAATLDRYGPMEGDPALLAAIRAELEQERRLDLSSSALLVTAGSNMAFNAVAQALCDPGDEVILPAPAYFNHVMAVQLAGGVPVLPQAGLIPDPQRLEAVITSRSRAIVTVSPNNPSGVVMPAAVLEAINDLCARHGLFHISDEAYAPFVHGTVPHHSPGSGRGRGRHTISLYSLSKAYGMAGWRVGYAAVPQALLPALAKVQDTILICPPRLVQHAARAALAAGSAWVAPRVEALGQRRRQLLDAVAQARAEGLDVRLWGEPDGAFYGLLEVATPLSGQELMRRLLLDHGVATLPGESFALGASDGRALLRLSYGLLDAPDLAAALERLFAGVTALDSSRP